MPILVKLMKDSYLIHTDTGYLNSKASVSSGQFNSLVAIYQINIFFSPSHQIYVFFTASRYEPNELVIGCEITLPLVNMPKFDISNIILQLKSIVIIKPVNEIICTCNEIKTLFVIIIHLRSMSIFLT